MHIDHPTASQLPCLKALWQEAFGDTDALIDLFFSTAFSPDRCLCVTEQGDVAAAAYYLDCSVEGRPYAYLYAVATGKAYRSRGYCRQLLAAMHSRLRERGYCGAILVPGEPGLFEMYGKMGYRTLSCAETVTCEACAAAAVRKATAEEYLRERSALLPAGGVEQEMGLTYLAGYAGLYTGDGFALAGMAVDGAFFGMELLGDISVAPGILGALGYSRGTFRIPGSQPFAMYHSLSDAPVPKYFGLAFD